MKTFQVLQENLYKPSKWHARLLESPALGWITTRIQNSRGSIPELHLWIAYTVSRLRIIPEEGKEECQTLRTSMHQIVDVMIQSLVVAELKQR